MNQHMWSLGHSLTTSCFENSTLVFIYVLTVWIKGYDLEEILPLDLLIIDLPEIFFQC